MPNLAAHIELASLVADRLQRPALNGNLGYFLLGSTAPDIRAITKSDREDYHFAPLAFRSVGAGVHGMFAAHPELRTPSKQLTPTTAFMAGYMTHLLYDETWIVEMFRPYFGNRDVFDDEVEGKVLDRAVQLDLDRRARPLVIRSLPNVEAATECVDVPFLAADLLNRWRSWVLDFVGRDFSWERLRFMASRVARGVESHPAHEVAADFLNAMPESIDRLYRRVHIEDVSRFKDRAVETVSRSIEGYLR